jgi:hypothetical protein
MTDNHTEWLTKHVDVVMVVFALMFASVLVLAGFVVAQLFS